MQMGTSFYPEGIMPWVIFILKILNAGITSGNIVITPKVAEVNQTATISCIVPAPRFWFLSADIVVQCNNNACVPTTYGSYTFTADSSKTDFIFQSLNRTRDERVWTCQYGSSNYSTTILIYALPRGLGLTQTPDMNADVGITFITIQCRTTSCTYPEPLIEWLYQDQPTSSIYEIYTRTIPSSAQGPCIFPEKIYTGSLSISQNTTWSDNSNKTVTFFCRIGYSDPSKNITSVASKPVSFAVRVTEAYLQHNNQNITSTLTVTSGEQVTLTCVTGTSRPAPNIDWYIGSRLVGSEARLIYTPSNTDHNEVIYCQAYNIYPNLKVHTNKPSLFVRVRVTEAYLQYNNQNITSTLTVTSGEKVTLTCVTGTSRPAPNIDWYIGSRPVGNGTSLIFTPNNTDHNEVIYCQAFNIDPNLKVDSNKLSLFVRVRVTEAFLQYNSQNITSTLTVTSGETVTLTCVTGTSRPSPSIGWYIGSQLTGSGTSLIFTPSNTDHNNAIYCQAYNNDPNLKVDSNKPALFVRVRVNEAYLQHNNQNISSTLIVTSGELVTLTCVTGISRPAPITDWYIGSQSMGSGTNLIFSPRNTDHNQVIYCQAYNINPNLKVDSNKPSLFVRGAPKILEISPSYKGYVGQYIIIMLDFYSNTDENLTVTARHSNFSGLIHQGIIRLIRPDDLQFYSSQIPAPVFRATLAISMKSTNDFGLYAIEVKNTVGSDLKIIQIIEQKTPEKPIIVHVTNMQEKQLSLTWHSGYDGGFTQNFVVEISPDNITWNNVYQVSAENRDGSFFTTIGNLIPGSQYYLRLYAYNINGRGDFADVQFAIRMLKEPAYTSSLEVCTSVGIGVGGAVGIGVSGIVLGLVGTLITFTIRRKLNGSKISCFSSKRKTDEKMHSYSNTEMNPQPVKAIYEELNKENTERSVYDKMSPL